MAVRIQNAISKGSTVRSSAVSTVKLLSLVLRPRLFREKEESSDLGQVGSSGCVNMSLGQHSQ
jgi:hypothetical protein